MLRRRKLQKKKRKRKNPRRPKILKTMMTISLIPPKLPKQMRKKRPKMPRKRQSLRLKMNHRPSLRNQHPSQLPSSKKLSFPHLMKEVKLNLWVMMLSKAT